MDVFGTESIGKVDESGIDHDSLFTSVQEILQVPKVTVAAADPVTRTVLFQHKHLTGREPPHYVFFDVNDTLQFKMRLHIPNYRNKASGGLSTVVSYN